MLDVKQITRVSSPAWIGNEYSSVCPFNSDASKVLLVANDHFVMVDTLKGTRTDLNIGASQEPRWSMRKPTTFYFIKKNALWMHDHITGGQIMVRSFSEYETIYGKGEGDISEDGDHFALCGDGADCFIYDLQTDGKSDIRPWDAFHIDSLVITPDNNVLLADVRGIAMYDSKMRFMKHVTPTNGHKDCCRDTNGDEYMVWTSNADNCVYKLRLADPEPFKTKQKLLWLDWSLAVQISCPLAGGFALISTYGLPPIDIRTMEMTNFRFGNQILKVALDGSTVEIMCDHDSKMIQRVGGGMEYNPTPKASLSRTGKEFVFCSNNKVIEDPNFINTMMVHVAPTIPAEITITYEDEPDGTWIDYRPYQGKEFIMRPQADGSVKIYERKKRSS